MEIKKIKHSKKLLENLCQLWKFVDAQRKVQFTVVLALSILASLAEALTISSVYPFMLALASPETIFNNSTANYFIEFLQISNSNQLSLNLTILFILGIVITTLLRITLLWTSNRLSSQIGSDLCNRIYQNTLYQPYAIHLERNSSEIMGGIMLKTNAVVSHIYSQIIALITAFIFSSFVLSSLVIINYGVAIPIFISFTLIYLIVIKLTKKKLKLNSERTNQEINNVIKIIQESMGGIRDIIVDGSQNTFIKIFRTADTRLRSAQVSNIFIAQYPKFIIEGISICIIAITAYHFSREENNWGESLAVLGAIILGMQRLLPAVQQGYTALSNIISGQTYLREALQLLDQSRTVNFDISNDLPVKFKTQLCLKNLCFRYSPNNPWVLKNLNLVIPKGSRIGIIGRTGSGKSTLVDVIMGLLTPSGGIIESDGIAITKENSRSWQNMIAHVPQVIFLTDNSIAENIAFGVPLNEINMDRVRNAALQAQLISFIEELPNGFDTLVGENGVRISGGQRQRIGIARALYKEATLIILDEVTSSLDTQTEESLMSSIQNLSNDLTFLIIAHRLSTLSICDQIVELSEQRIIQKGSYDEIIGSKLVK